MQRQIDGASGGAGQVFEAGGQLVGVPGAQHLGGVGDWGTGRRDG
ncbi:hypothetical protein [Streptomyces melanogenes]